MTFKKILETVQNYRPQYTPYDLTKDPNESARMYAFYMRQNTATKKDFFELFDEAYKKIINYKEETK